MRFAYGDPPYLGCCKLYDHHHPDGLCWDDLATHAALIDRLDGIDSRYDGWALSATSVSLPDLLPLLRDTYGAKRFGPVRIGAWVKPFAAFKRNVRIAYTWEPVIFRPGRDSSSDGAPVGRDHLAEAITMRKGLTGAKPRAFCDWVLDLIGWVPGDELDDLYPGTGVMGSVIKARLWEIEEINGQAPLDFGDLA